MTGQIAAALARADVVWIVLAVVLHLGGQAVRGLAWHGVLHWSWPGSRRRSVCAWHVCGAGLTGAFSSRGGDVVRLALARRELHDATVPALAGSLLLENSFEMLSGWALTGTAVWLGVGSFAPPPLRLVVALALGAVLLAVTARRSPRIRRIAAELLRGLSGLRNPRSFAWRVLPWQVASRLLRLAAVWCFLKAFGLPTDPVVLVAAAVAQGSGNTLPLPGVGIAASAAAIVAALPLAAGHPLPAGELGALALTQTAGLTVLGVATSTAVLSALVDLRRPLTAVRGLLTPRPAEA
jgi:Lysylphosphatidylglycerol synthase TM region